MLFQLKKAQIDDFCYWFSVSTLGSSLVLIKIGSSDVVSFTGTDMGTTNGTLKRLIFKLN